MKKTYTDPDWAPDLKKEYDDYWTNVNSIDQGFDDVTAKLKEIKSDEENKEYYDAVKAYYSSISSFKNLVRTFPEGYSKLTYSQALSSAKDDCLDAKAGLDLYK